MDRICAIHQPNFFPWLGYFDKLRTADIFVFLDAVDYPKSGSGMGSWSNRVRVDIQGEARWIGCNLQRFSGALPIKDVRMSETGAWREKLLKTLQMNYRRAPNFKSAMDILEPLIMAPTDNLADFNIAAILTLSEHLEIDVKAVRQSALSATGKATQLLINLTKEVGCDTYLCGGGADGYQDDELFASSGLTLRYQNFRPEPYGNADTFIAGLSVIDYLMKR